MKIDLANRKGTALAKPDEPVKPRSAIELLPEEFQAPVRFFFGFYSDTLRGTTGIATRFRWWIQEDALTVAEVKIAMKRLMSPERSAEIDTSPKALAALSAEIGAILRDRRAREETERRREACSEKQPLTEFELVKQKLAEGMKP